MTGNDDETALPTPVAERWARPSADASWVTPPVDEERGAQLPGERPLVVAYLPVMNLPPQPFAVRPPVPEGLQPPRRSVRWRVAVVLAVVLALAVPVAALARTAAFVAKAHGPALAASALAASASPSKPREPTASDRIVDVLGAESKALLAGDQDGYLAAIETSNLALREEFARRFGSLRSMRVSTWDQKLDTIDQATSGSWVASVVVRYCFVAPDCTPVPMRIDTEWTVTADAHVWLRKYDNADLDYVRPWDVSDLRSAVGRRVVISTTVKYASRLPAMVAAADKAADVVDRYAKWGPPPARYLVFLAGPDEWAKWYSGVTSKWAAGYATRVSPDSADVVLNATRVAAADTGYVLRHELAHVVTLDGGKNAYHWWLVEGIAEYVRVTGGGTAFDGAADVRRFVRSGHWAGDVALDAPGDTASVGDVRGYYGIAYMALRRIADRFGEAKMLDFFDLSVRQGNGLDVAASKALGATWESVSADCAQYVRSRS